MTAVPGLPLRGNSIRTPSCATSALPDGDGYDVARKLRQDGLLQHTRLVALSGYAQPEDRQRAHDAGFDAHIPKPASLDALLAVLAKDS